MFKLGVISDEISQDLQTAVDLAKKFNLEAIEIRSVEGKNSFDFENEDVSKIKRIMKNSGLKTCCISSPFYKCDITSPEEIAANIKGLEKSIYLASQLGTNLIRGFTFWKKSTAEKSLKEIAYEFQKPIRMLENAGMTLVIESDPTVHATNAEGLVRVIEAIDSPTVKALWDPGNDIFDPDGETPYPDGYSKIKPHIAHVHLKDAIKDSDGKISSCPFGHGMVDFKGQFESLIEDSYTGYVVMETHYRKKIELSKEILEMPKGENFSLGAYEATEESLENLMQLLKNISK